MFFKFKRTERLNRVRQREAEEEANFRRFFQETFAKVEQEYYVEDVEVYFKYLHWMRVHEKEDTASPSRLTKYLSEKENLQSVKWGKEKDVIWLGLRFRDPNYPVHHLCKGRHLKDVEPLPVEDDTPQLVKLLADIKTELGRLADTAQQEKQEKQEDQAN